MAKRPVEVWEVIQRQNVIPQYHLDHTEHEALCSIYVLGLLKEKEIPDLPRYVANLPCICNEPKPWNTKQN